MNSRPVKAKSSKLAETPVKGKKNIPASSTSSASSSSSSSSKPSLRPRPLKENSSTAAAQQTDENRSTSRLDDIFPQPVPQRLSISLIRHHCLPADFLAANEAAAVNEKLFDLRQIFLDGLAINAIDDLELFQEITHLFLQRNLICRIENLESLHKLEFLVLANNGISELTGLKTLKKLKFLDLRNNRIEDFDIDEMPENLEALEMLGNSCVFHPQYKAHCMAGLPWLERLDGQEITEEMRKEAGLNQEEEVDDDEEEDDEDLSSADFSRCSITADSLPSQASSGLGFGPEARELLKASEDSAASLVSEIRENAAEYLERSRMRSSQAAAEAPQRLADLQTRWAEQFPEEKKQ